MLKIPSDTEFKGNSEDTLSLLQVPPRNVSGMLDFISGTLVPLTTPSHMEGKREKPPTMRDLRISS